MQKILYVVNNADFLLSHRFSLLKTAQEKGYDVHVASPISESIERLAQNGIQHHEWNLSRKSINPLEEFQVVRKLHQIYKALKPDLAHHLTIKPIIYGGMAASLVKTPAIVNAVCGMGSTYISNSIKFRLLRQLTNQGFRYAGKRSQSRYIFQNVDDQYYFIRKKITDINQTMIIPGSGVCMQEFRPLPLPSTTPYIIVLAARLLREKGVQEFVDAAKALHSQQIARFVLVGDVDPGNPSSLTRAEINDWVKAGIVEWWGFQKDMQAVFARSHVICLPSYREGMPRVLIEAAACGRPIITTDTVGCKELVRHGENGLLVPVKNAQALAQAVISLLQNPANLERWGMASRRLVEEKYSLNAVINKTISLYQELLDKYGK